MTTEEKTRDAKEFVSLLLSCELAIEFNKDKPNRAIKHTLKAVEARVTSTNIKLVCQQGRKQMFPLGWVKKQLHNVSRFGGLGEEQFLKIGSEL